MPTPEHANNLHGLLVGVNFYHDTAINRLHFAVNDAQELGQTLLDPIYSFRSRNASLLLSTDESENNALRRNILKTLTQVANNASEQDLLLFYFSGHGHLVKGEPYLCSSDTETDFVNDTAVSLARVREIINASQASIKVLILDACNIGSGKGEKGFNDSKEFTEKTQKIFKGVRGLAMLASSSREEVSIETPDKKHGVFTYFFLEALRNYSVVDENKDLKISVTEIFNYVAANVQKYGQSPRILLEASGDLPMFHISESSARPNPIRSVFPSPVKNPDDFFGRVSELREVQDQLLNTSDILIYVHGERCVGKTSYLNRIKSILEKDVSADTKFSYLSIDPSSMNNVSAFAREIWNGVKNICQTTLNISYNENPFSFDGYGSFQVELSELLRLLPAHNLVVVIDEIQKIKSFTDNVQFSQIIGLLRYLIEQTDLPIAFVVSSFESQQQFFPESFGSPPPNVDIELLPLERNACNEMLVSLFTLDYKDKQTLFENIYLASGGHPFVAKMLAAEVYDELQSTSFEGPFPETAWENLVYKTANLNNANNLFSSLYSNFSDDERYVLLFLALQKDYSISSQEVNQWKGSHRSAANQLEKEKHYLIGSSSSGYRLRLQLLGYWLNSSQENFLSLEAERLGVPKREWLLIDEKRNKVFVNREEVNVPKLQYQALLYLANNVDRVVSGNELIRFVYSEDNEQISGNDQRIGSLIYRLRETLGDNEQKHLQTLPRQGYVLKQTTLISR